VMQLGWLFIFVLTIVVVVGVADFIDRMTS
jgi:hypothetical protein